jgi:hypothetical protein
MEGQRQAPEQEEAVWLQNEEGKCLGPTARFTDCGDATLWFIVKRKLHTQRRRHLLRMGIFGVEEEEAYQPLVEAAPREGLAFYVVDRDLEQHYHQQQHQQQQGGDSADDLSSALEDMSGRGPWWKRMVSRRRKRQRMECLTHEVDGRVTVESCTAASSWAWEMDSEGTLKPRQLINGLPTEISKCLVGTDTGLALGPCADIEEVDESSRTTPINLSIVRYRTISLPDALQQLSSSLPKQKSKELATQKPADEVSRALLPPVRTNEEGEKDAPSNLPSRRMDLAHLHASEPGNHRLLMKSSTPALSRSTRERPDGHRAKLSPLQILLDANPVHAFERTSLTGEKHARTTLGNHRATVAPTEPTAYRSRKIPVHPYIAAAKNEVWTDPQTGLAYPTDLSGYLGHDRKEHGRQTLMGVGQYRKGYVIKVYGVAYYVSKRDVLADPFFSDYADMTPDQLRSKPQFYHHLRNEGDNFERTIMIKTNMQLATDTIRNSLHADWKMLTEEAKYTLINSSLQPRPCNEEFLGVIADATANPGRCSCGQIAPPEYEADKDCCARGTELVFTWLKSKQLEVREIQNPTFLTTSLARTHFFGSVQVRLNGVLMDTFPRPDIAEGILFEYLRNDDPISPEFRDSVVLGFPFLLAPLAQVKGVHLPHSKPSISPTHSVPPHKAIFHMLENFQAGVTGWAVGTSQATFEAASHQVAAAGRWGERTSQAWFHEANQRRQLIARQVQEQGFPGFIRAVLTSTADPTSVVNKTLFLEPEPDLTVNPLSRLLLDHMYPDEIGPPVRQVHPQRQGYLLLVHLYLLLLLIVSFPGSYTTKLKRLKKSRPDTGLPLKTKSLSYYL